MSERDIIRRLCPAFAAICDEAGLWEVWGYNAVCPSCAADPCRCGTGHMADVGDGGKERVG